MNLDTYTSEMAKSVWDKAFFMDKIPGAKCVIDFGCADGAMIRFLAPLFPDIVFVGYDISDELITRARKTPPYYANAVFFDGSERYGYEHVIHFIQEKFEPDEVCINFSSVLHEVFSTTKEGKHIIKRLLDAIHPKYITIRDMYFEGENRVLAYYYIKEVMNAFKVKEGFIESFEDEHSSICSVKFLHHFLLKYQWHENGWEEENAEDYFSWTLRDFKGIADAYTCIYENHYMLPYYREQWHKVNLFPVEANTHAQFILKRWY